MSEERKRILGMLAEGKISADEAEKLIAALGSEGESGPTASGGAAAQSSAKKVPKYLFVRVNSQNGSGEGDKVNIRVPLSLVRAGIKLASLVPKEAQSKVNEHLKEKGVDIDLSQVTPENIDELLSNLGELTVDVESGKETVKIFCE